MYVRSFADSNGDGRGDLQGIIDHLPYLQELGIDAIWLCPCFPSPQMDHGYDVADYFDIEPTYGDLATFDRMVAAAATRHQGDARRGAEPLQQPARMVQGSTGCPEGQSRAGAVLVPRRKGEHGELPPNNWMAIFGGPAWTRITEPDGTLGQWYLHVFTPWQPDFNWENEDVADHFDRMLTFWFDRGVEGFRVDAVGVVGKTEGLPDQLVPERRHGHRAGRQERAHPVQGACARLLASVADGDRRVPGRASGARLVTVSEAYTPGRPDLLLKFVEPDQFHQSFNFDLMLAPWIAGPIRQSVAEVYDVLTGAGASVTWTLNNHDTQRPSPVTAGPKRPRWTVGRATTWSTPIRPSTRSWACGGARRWSSSSPGSRCAVPLSG